MTALQVLSVVKPTDHLGLVHFIARKYRGLGLSYDELVSAGYLGLIVACRLYDPGRGQAKFSTYAVKAIRGHITGEITRNSVVRIPRSNFDVPAKLEKTVQFRRLLRLYRKQAEHIVSLDDRSALPVAVREHALTDPRSLSESGYHAVEWHAEREMLQEAVAIVLRSISQREADVISLRLGIGCDQPYTLREVGRIFRVTHERIRQIELEAMRKLQRKDWKVFLGKYVHYVEEIG